MGSLHRVVVYKRFFFFQFSSQNSKSLFLLGNTNCSGFCLCLFQLIVSQLLQNSFAGLSNHRLLSFFSFHDKFVCMVSDMLEEKSPHYLQTGLTTFDTRQLSYSFFEMVIHIQILTVWHLCVYRTFRVAYASVNALRSMNKLLLSIVSIWSTSLGGKEESQLQTKGWENSLKK